MSGDNASLDAVREIADQEGPFDVAVLFAGAARTPLVPAAPLTLTSEDAARAAVILDAVRVIPLHRRGPVRAIPWRMLGVRQASPRIDSDRREL